MKLFYKPDRILRRRWLPASLLAAAGLSLVAGQARATVEPNVAASQGDLILGFQETGDNDLEVDLGPINNFLNATTIQQIHFGVIPGGSTAVASLATDLAAVYGSGWNSSSLLQWGVVGSSVSGASSGNIFLTIDSLTSSIPQDPANQSASTTANDINLSLISQGLAESPSTANSTETANVINGSANAWDGFLPSTSAFDTTFNIEQKSGVDTATASTLNLWELTPNRFGGGNGADIGSFALNSTGNLTFTPASVPEPSTWISFIGGTALLGFFRLRRQRRIS